MEESIKKKVDESWKEQAEQEKHTVEASKSTTAPSAAAVGSKVAPAAPQEASQPRERDAEEAPQARFDLFLSGLAMEALIALGEVPHPVTRKQSANLPHAKYLIDVLGILDEKTKGNVTVEEGQLLKDALYQLRMRYLAKAGG